MNPLLALMQPMKRPLWRYYGGKFRAARHYPAPAHRTIIEPFAGAAGYSCRYPHHDVVLVDASEKVCAVWEYLIGASASEILALPDLVRGESVDDLDLPQDVRWFIGFWCNVGAASPRKTLSKWASKAGKGNWNQPSTRVVIAAQVARIKHWRVIHGTYADAPDTPATWFVDPPYRGAQGAHYPHGSGAIDYADLGAWCRSREGQTIVCEGPNADWLPFEPFRTIKAAPGHKRDGKSIEMIWTNSN